MSNYSNIQEVLCALNLDKYIDLRLNWDELCGINERDQLIDLDIEKLGERMRLFRATKLICHTSTEAQLSYLDIKGDWNEFDKILHGSLE